MCSSCVAEYTNGQNVPATPLVERATSLIRDWYGIPGCSTGGALHVVLDDYNVETHFVEWCAGEVDKWLDAWVVEYADVEADAWSGYDRASIKQSAIELTTALLALSEAERAVAIAGSEYTGQ